MKLKSLRKYVVWFIATVLILFTVLPSVEIGAYAEEINGEVDEGIGEVTYENQNADYFEQTGSDYLGIEIIEIDDEPVLVEDAETATDSDADYGYSINSFSLYSSEDYISTKDFSVYGNSYIRDYLNDAERTFYDCLDDVCRAYLTGTKDVPLKEYNNGSSSAYVLSDNGIVYSGLTKERAKEILGVFSYQNPQYYFLSYRWLSNSSKIWPVCYEAFTDGDTRASVTEELFSRVDGWVDQVNIGADDYEKEKLAENIICANTIYLSDSGVNGGQEQPYAKFADYGWTGYDQSAYSMIMLGTTVCAGYSKSFQMLMNASGVLTIGVTGYTSVGHAWNKVRIGGYWYDIDVTWDDGSGGNRTTSQGTYRNKRDADFSMSGHNLDSIYSQIAPGCILDFNENEWNTYYSIPATGISIDGSKDIILYRFEDENTVDIETRIIPEAADNDGYIVRVEDESIAYAVYHTVLPVNPGETYVTVISEDGSFKDSRKVIVYEKFSKQPAPAIENITQNSVTLAEPDDSNLFTYEYSKDKINWQRSNEFTGLSPGTGYTFYIRMAGTTYYLASDASDGVYVTTLKDEKSESNNNSNTDTGSSGSSGNTGGTGNSGSQPSQTDKKTVPSNSYTLSSGGIYVMSTAPEIVAGCIAKPSNSNAVVEYRWVACNQDDQKWFEVSPWTKNNQWLRWRPETNGNYIVVCYARVVGNEDASLIQQSVGITAHPHIKGICQMPYTGEGGGFLIGVETYDNPNQSYRYEMLILDCTLLAKNLPAWTYTTGQCGVASGNALWTVWQPQYGYYWTLFRIYDKNGKLIDEQCYGFVNAY